MARSEYLRGAPRRPEGFAFQALTAAGENQTVISPRRTALLQNSDSRRASPYPGEITQQRPGTLDGLAVASG